MCLFLGKVREKEREDSWKEKIQIWIWNLRPYGSWIYPGGGGDCFTKRKGHTWRREGHIPWGFLRMEPRERRRSSGWNQWRHEIQLQRMLILRNTKTQTQTQIFLPSHHLLPLPTKKSETCYLYNLLLYTKGQERKLKVQVSLFWFSERERERELLHTCEGGGWGLEESACGWLYRKERGREEWGVVECLSSIMTSCQ